MRPACLRCGDFELAPATLTAGVPLCRGCLARPVAAPPRVGAWAYSLESLPRIVVTLALVVSLGFLLRGGAPSPLALAAVAALILGVAVYFAAAWRRLRRETFRALGFGEDLTRAGGPVEARVVLALRREGLFEGAYTLETALLLLGAGGVVLYGWAPSRRLVLARAPEGEGAPVEHPCERPGWLRLGADGSEAIAPGPFPGSRAARRLALEVTTRLEPRTGEAHAS